MPVPVELPHLVQAPLVPLKSLVLIGPSRSPNGHYILNHFWIQVAVSELKRPSRSCFGSETATHLQRLY